MIGSALFALGLAWAGPAAADTCAGLAIHETRASVLPLRDKKGVIIARVTPQEAGARVLIVRRCEGANYVVRWQTGEAYVSKALVNTRPLTGTDSTYGANPTGEDFRYALQRQREAAGKKSQPTTLCASAKDVNRKAEDQLLGAAGLMKSPGAKTGC
jgi:hypothetical protein